MCVIWLKRQFKGTVLWDFTVFPTFPEADLFFMYLVFKGIYWFLTMKVGKTILRYCFSKPSLQIIGYVSSF